MSFGGILATALAGGAGVVGKQAGDDIEAQRKADMLRQQADIEEQMRMRLAEMDDRRARDRTLWETTGEGGAAKLDLARRIGEQATDLTIKGKVAEATNPELVAAEDARADAELQRKIKAGKALLPLEIERASKLAAADAGTRAKYREKPQTMGEKAAELETFLGRKLLPEERERMSGLAKGGGEETVKTTEYDANGQPIKERTVKGPRGAEQPGAKPTEQQAHAEAEAAIKNGGASRDAVNARLVELGYKPLGGDPGKPGSDKPELKRMIQSAAPKDPVQTMSDRTLSQIAQTPGHAKQRAAQAEIERRKTNAPETDATGIGYGSAS